ncbi:hypothetical protein R70006_04923 [Paraburkholderia domus]|uniref:hypothetical protein n=1 Tax=Paraburkholderia domus TaxID=2793075 RepID=UPI001911FA45|nr:hypothetical protein [Paraburkholderia domus]MBK5051838.1 hypothetical protein [Burkholderia sp. R-70006]CAE6792749.1 hypothetical protein R70006_04923 [Paraburkholderia domus]
MKISELIAQLEGFRAQYGDVDVVCTAGYQVPEDEDLADRHLSIVERDDNASAPTGVSAPYLLIGGSGY